jgi:hypothetical protein
LTVVHDETGGLAGLVGHSDLEPIPRS